MFYENTVLGQTVTVGNEDGLDERKCVADNKIHRQLT